MPLTAFRALRHGSSRYSARMGGAGSIERAFGKGVDRLTLPLPTGPRHVHCYLVDGEEGRLLIDTGLGLPGDEDAWNGLEADSIVLTHMHPDHVGGAESAAGATGAAVHQLELDYDQCVRVWGSADWPERMAAWFRSHGVPAPVADARGARRGAAHRLRRLRLALRRGPFAAAAPLRGRRDALAPRAPRRARAGRAGFCRRSACLYCGVVGRRDPA